MDFRQNIILISSLTCLVLQIISSNVVHWTKYNYMTNILTCKPSKILFSTENVHDPSECTKMCFFQHNCLVVTFIPELNKCVGCQEYRHAGIYQTSAEIQYSIRPAHDYHFSCKEVLEENRQAKSGVYIITPNFTETSVDAFCDMTTDGGGWTVFQNRFDGSVDFVRNLTDYENGFGNLEGEFWLGLNIIRRLLKNVTNIRYEMTSVDGTTSYEVYGGYLEENDVLVSIGYLETELNETDKTKDLLSVSLAPFLIFDQDTFENCSGIYGGGWWYKDKACGDINLNGKYGPGGGFYHRGLNGNKILKSSKMMARLYLY
ncbi:microfibril-associated glycoprotein 4-like [Ruditapes philippinarum]|uniref:microfibril-associated glycoprotein 4-like n=1 Tax=Ruditapes philippinarum TaxID=129788 RepID=UPI00295A90F0|nr:microfibril-associated glycoprotein 4-like [Ruditapes philippinarum]